MPFEALDGSHDLFLRILCNCLFPDLLYCESTCRAWRNLLRARVQGDPWRSAIINSWPHTCGFAVSASSNRKRMGLNLMRTVRLRMPASTPLSDVQFAVQISTVDTIPNPEYVPRPEISFEARKMAQAIRYEREQLEDDLGPRDRGARLKATKVVDFQGTLEGADAAPVWYKQTAEQLFAGEPPSQTGLEWDIGVLPLPDTVPAEPTTAEEVAAAMRAASQRTDDTMPPRPGQPPPGRVQAPLGHPDCFKWAPRWPWPPVKYEDGGLFKSIQVTMFRKSDQKLIHLPEVRLAHATSEEMYFRLVQFSRLGSSDYFLKTRLRPRVAAGRVSWSLAFEFAGDVRYCEPPLYRSDGNGAYEDVHQRWNGPELELADVDASGAICGATWRMFVNCHRHRATREQELDGSAAALPHLLAGAGWA